MVPQELNTTDDFDARLDGVSVYQISQHRRTTDTPLATVPSKINVKTSSRSALTPTRLSHFSALVDPSTLPHFVAVPHHVLTSDGIVLLQPEKPPMVSFAETGSDRVECGYVHWTLARLLRRH